MLINDITFFRQITKRNEKALVLTEIASSVHQIGIFQVLEKKM